MRHRGFAIAILLALLALPVAAQDFEKGVAAHKRGDYATALREWRPLAEQGIRRTSCCSLSTSTSRSPSRRKPRGVLRG